MTTRLDSKIALVTGAASGIGAATSRALVDAGAHVIVTDIADEPGRAVAESLGASGHYEHLDVTQRSDWDGVLGKIEREHGRLDVLVHNAGGGVAKDLESVTLEQWRWVQSLNVESVFQGTQAALPLMRKSGEPGSIIVISSVAGLIGVPSLAAYGAAKGASRMLAKTIALHCAQRGDPIRCNSIHPAFTDTPMVHALANAAKDPAKALDRLAKSAPIGRLGRPEEIAGMVVYLASDASAFVTGTEMVLDGGMTAM